MTNDVQTKAADAPMTAEQVSEKFNGGKKVIDFVGKKKVFFGLSLAIMLIGLICNFIFGTTLDIQFTGGATLTYSYTVDKDHPIDQEELRSFIQEHTKDKITASFSTDLMGNTGENVSVQFSGNDSIKTDIQENLTKDLQKKYPDNNFKNLEANSVDASMGFMFLLKCLAAVALASVLMVLYVTIRFKKIGGLSAGVMALVALFHDIAMIYFLYVIFQMPIDSNFIAVVLMILGYSLNDTIVIYDRVREQRKLMGRKTDVGTVFNVSCTKTLKRTIMTSVTTLSAIMVVYILAFIFNINSVKSFALPMMIGVISGKSCQESLKNIIKFRVLASFYGGESFFCARASGKIHVGATAVNMSFHLRKVDSDTVDVVVDQQRVQKRRGFVPVGADLSAQLGSLCKIVLHHQSVNLFNSPRKAVSRISDIPKLCAGGRKANQQQGKGNKYPFHFFSFSIIL